MTPEVITTLVIGVIAGGSLYGFLQFLITRHDKKDDNTVLLNELLKKSEKRDLEISKILLTILLEHNPQDHKAILDEGTRYFTVLGGNSWMWDKFADWAEKEKVDVSYIKTYHDNNKKGVLK